jgi:hypothetical protein
MDDFVSLSRGVLVAHFTNAIWRVVCVTAVIVVYSPNMHAHPHEHTHAPWHRFLFNVL